MAEAKKCDRCGRFYETNSSHETVGRIYNGIIGGIATASRGGSADKWFDLCDDCILDLLKFMKGAKVIEVPQQESND